MLRDTNQLFLKIFKDDCVYLTNHKFITRFSVVHQYRHAHSIVHYMYV